MEVVFGLRVQSLGDDYFHQLDGLLLNLQTAPSEKAMFVVPLQVERVVDYVGVRHIHVPQKVVGGLKRKALGVKEVAEAGVAVGMIGLTQLVLPNGDLTDPMTLLLVGLNTHHFVAETGSMEASPLLFGLSHEDDPH